MDLNERQLVAPRDYPDQDYTTDKQERGGESVSEENIKTELRALIGEIISECDIEPAFSEDGDAVVGYSVDLPSYYFEQILGLAGFKTYLDAQTWVEQQTNKSE